jgi:hypothetical protein
LPTLLFLLALDDLCEVGPNARGLLLLELALALVGLPDFGKLLLRYWII